MISHHDLGMIQLMHPHDADPAITQQLTDCWVAVTNADGAASFPFPRVNARQDASAVDELAAHRDP